MNKMSLGPGASQLLGLLWGEKRVAMGDEQVNKEFRETDKNLFVFSFYLVV